MDRMDIPGAIADILSARDCGRSAHDGRARPSGLTRRLGIESITIATLCQGALVRDIDIGRCPRALVGR
jgi:hypothetical protein